MQRYKRTQQESNTATGSRGFMGLQEYRRIQEKIILEQPGKRGTLAEEFLLPLVRYQGRSHSAHVHGGHRE